MDLHILWKTIKTAGMLFIITYFPYQNFKDTITCSILNIHHTVLLSLFRVFFYVFSPGQKLIVQKIFQGVPRMSFEHLMYVQFTSYFNGVAFSIPFQYANICWPPIGKIAEQLSYNHLLVLLHVYMIYTCNNFFSTEIN